MERKIANIDEFQVDENGIPLFPVGLKEEASSMSSPTGVTSAGSTDRGRRSDHL